MLVIKEKETYNDRTLTCRLSTNLGLGDLS